MSELTPNEEEQKKEETVIPSSSEEAAVSSSSEQSAQIVDSETQSQSEEIEDLKAPIQFEPIFKAQPLEVVAQSSSFENNSGTAKSDSKQKSKKSPGFWVFCILIAAVVIASIIGSFIPDKDFTDVIDNSGITSLPSKNKKNRLPKYNHDYIARIDIKGTIQEKNETYNQKWLLDTVDNLMKDSKNKGLFIYVDSPGGTVYEADELYLKLCEYKENTGRPVYAYFAHMAASGGYYIGCVADYIMANRNCTTGSIGVIMGPIFTLNGLFEKYGIETTSITAGRNKNMLNMNEPITEEQRKIMQDYINEAYDQFTGIVSKERSLSIERVREIADGRVYTAQQALDIKLIDKVCGYEESVEYMKNDLFNDAGIALEYVEYTYEKSFSDFFSTISMKFHGKNADSFLENMTERMTACPKGPSYFYGGAF